MANFDFPLRGAAANPTRERREGLLTVGHGTRDPRGLAEFLALVDTVADLCPEMAVEPCFLELAEPDIASGVERIAARGVRRLTVMPLLLFAAGHAKRDIPREIAQAAARHPELEIRQAGHLGCHEAVLALSEKRFQQAVSARAPIKPDDTLLLLVGRGSRDPEATLEMVQFAGLCYQRRAVGRLEIAFLAMAEPSLEAALARAADLPYHQVIVQPHLLFHGELLDRLRVSVAATAGKPPRHEWTVTEPLEGGGDLAAAVVAIVQQAQVVAPGARIVKHR